MSYKEMLATDYVKALNKIYRSGNLINTTKKSPEQIVEEVYNWGKAAPTTNH